LSDWAGLEGLLELRGRLHGWARGEERILAAVAFGSTERTDRTADAWSDLDLLLVVEDPKPWLDDLAWVDSIGPPWLRFVHAAPIPGIKVVQVLFEGGYDADLVPVDREMLAMLQMPEVAAEVFGHGARLVVDRVGALDALLGEAGTFPVASVSAIRPPDAGEFAETVSTFLYQAVWATKRLRRGERWRAHDDVDDYMRDRLLRMSEWHALARGEQEVHPESRRLERWVPDDVAVELPATFARYDDATIAEAIVRGHGLFRRLAREVADRWHLAYPDAADAAIEAWVMERLKESGTLPSEQG
jgi:aminoglycoside 6-adenylyltransferase